MNPLLSRGLSWLAAALIGGVYGLAATIAHGFMWGVLPVGLLLGAVACAALLIALRTLTGDRWAALAAGIGMIALILTISQRGPGGSVVVPNTPLGNIWMYVVGGIIVLVVAWPDFSRLRASMPTAPAATPATPTAAPTAPGSGPHSTDAS